MLIIRVQFNLQKNLLHYWCGIKVFLVPVKQDDGSLAKLAVAETCCVTSGSCRVTSDDIKMSLMKNPRAFIPTYKYLDNHMMTWR